MRRKDVSVWTWAGWHLLVLATVFVVPARLVFGAGPWGLPGQNSLLILGLGGVYAVAAIVSVVSERRLGWSGPLALAATGIAGLAVLFLGILLYRVSAYSRAILLMGFSLVAAGVAAPLLWIRHPRATLVSTVGAGTLAAGAYALSSLGVVNIPSLAEAETVVRTWIQGPAEPGRRSEIIGTNRITLEATYYTDQFPEPTGPSISGGALAHHPGGRGYFLARSTGEIFKFSWSDPTGLEVETLGIRVPINTGEFVVDAGQDLAERGFRVADIAATSDSGRVRLYASHHYWKRRKRCFVVRLSTILLPEIATDSSPSSDEWSTVFETEPCLGLKPDSRSLAFAGLQIGGNLLLRDSTQLLLTVGDHEFDGWNGQPNLPQDPNSHYGKTLSIDASTGATEIFTMGHRNQQGLTVDARGRIWSAEHGPMGGDELNLLRMGGNYGWPYQTHGTDYFSVVWPMADSAPDIPFVSPVYAWVPSIGISELVAVTDTAFQPWIGDLLVGSLGREQLWRLRLEEEWVVYAEPIPIGERIRDILASGSGTFVLWTDAGTIVRIEPSRLRDRGAALFAQQCAGCHGTDIGVGHGIGPNLHGVFNRALAGAEGYAYSTAMRGSEGRWSEDRLLEFIANPDSLIPGTSMTSPGVPDSVTRRAIVEYLESLN